MTEIAWLDKAGGACLGNAVVLGPDVSHNCASIWENKFGKGRGHIFSAHTLDT